MNYTYGFILALSIFATAFTLWKANLLIAICTSAAWWAMLAFHLANTPTNITKGSPADVMIVLAFIGFALVVPYYALQQGKYSKESGGRSRAGGNDRNNHENGHAESSGRISYSSSEKPRGLMDLTPEEYKAYLHSKMNRRRR